MSPRGRVAAGRRIDVARVGVRGGLPDATIRRVVDTVIRAERAKVAAISVTLVSAAAMKRLNRRHLGRTGLTDVISFSLPDGAGVITGDIYIAPAAAELAVAEHGESLRSELVRLVVHGTLHALGWDHPEGSGRMRSAMWRRQEQLLKRINGRRR